MGSVTCVLTSEYRRRAEMASEINRSPALEIGGVTSILAPLWPLLSNAADNSSSGLAWEIS